MTKAFYAKYSLFILTVFITAGVYTTPILAETSTDASTMEITTIINEKKPGMLSGGEAEQYFRINEATVFYNQYDNEMAYKSLKIPCKALIKYISTPESAFPLAREVYMKRSWNVEHTYELNKK